MINNKNEKQYQVKSTSRLKNAISIKERYMWEIITAYKENNINAMKRWQKKLVEDKDVQWLAIYEMLKNKGNNTPGLDNFIVKNEEDKARLLAEIVNIKNYKLGLLKRVSIPKDNGKTRVLSIPTIKDRCMQKLFLYSLWPIAEWTADRNSYGFRSNRSCHNAVMNLYFSYYKYWQGTKTLYNKYLVKIDIKGFFDNINHQWIIDNIPMDKVMLNKFLKAGYINDLRQYVFNEAGVPQGGIISPIIANMVLDGLEQGIKDKLDELSKKKSISKSAIFNTRFTRYADDFIVMTYSKYMADQIKEFIITFLKDRGLEINEDKSRIINVHEESLDYLGFTFKVVDKTVVMYPSKKSLNKFIKKVKGIISKAQTTEFLINNINPVIQGWGNYFGKSSAYQHFKRLDYYIYQKIVNQAKKVYVTNSLAKIYNKWFDKTKSGKVGNVFYIEEKGAKRSLFKLTSIKCQYPESKIYKSKWERW